MIFVGHSKYPKIMKFVLPLFYGISNLQKKFGTNFMMLNYIFSYML
jgi:hypothetical protein